MQKLTILIAAAISLPLLRGQGPAGAPQAAGEPLESAIIHVKTLDGDAFDRLVRLLRVFGASTEADDHLRTIVVYGRPNVISQMRHVVEELDKPGSEAAIGHNIEMTLTFLRCSDKQTAAAPLPPDIESVAKQLRAVTQYKSVELWEVVPLHLQEGKDTTESLRLPRPEHVAAAAPGDYIPFPMASISVRPDSIQRRDATRYVRFQSLRIELRVPYQVSSAQWNFNDLSLKTSGDFAEGQKTVLGKLSGIDEGSATFIVVTLKVLD